MTKSKKENEVRKMYRLSWSSGMYDEFFCQECVSKPLEQNYIEKSIEIDFGNCYSCGYRRDEKIVSKEKALSIEDEIKEMKKLIRDISSQKKEVSVNQILLHSVKEYKNEAVEITAPIDVRQNLKFPLRLNSKILVKALERHIKDLKLKKEEILNK